MARLPRLVVAGQPHLVVQRSGGAQVFADDADRQSYLDALREVLVSSGVALHAFALQDDGVFLLATPRAAPDLGAFVQRVNRRYVPAFHRRHGGRGPIWAGRFQAAAIDPERYLLPAMLLVEQAAVRAGAVDEATQWAWSSAGHHTGRSASALISEHPAWWKTGNTPFEREARHESALGRALAEREVAELLAAVRGGWVLGSARFVEAVAQDSRRSVRPQPRGRPRKDRPAP